MSRTPVVIGPWVKNDLQLRRHYPDGSEAARVVPLLRGRFMWSVYENGPNAGAAYGDVNAASEQGAKDAADRALKILYPD